jgi:hypothetical protein
MKSIILLLAAAGISLLVSCEKENTFDTFRTVPIYTERVDMPDSVALMQVCNYTFHGTLGSECHWFYRLERTSRGNEVNITAYADARSLVCLAVGTLVDLPGHLTFFTRGTYSIHFWQTDSTSLDKSLTVY